MTNRRRNGLTLVELMSAIGIIGLLMALIIPAIRSARIRSQRIACLNNLMQIGLAMSNYHSVNGCFPVGAFGRNGAGYPLSGDPGGVRNRRTWAFAIPPYIEATSRYNSINFAVGFDDPMNTTVVRAPVPFHTCPADPGSVAPIDAGLTSERVRGNYVVNWGNTHSPQAAGPDPFNGPLGVETFGGAPFGQDVPRTMMTITDGLATTLLMSEVLSPAPLGPRSDRRGDFYNDDPNAGMFMGYSPPNSTSPDQMPIIAGSPGCVFPCGDNPPCNTKSPAYNAARSFHPGGVHALMSDGSVRFATDSTSVGVWRALSSSHGAEPPGPDSY